TDAILSLKWSPDGHHLVSGGYVADPTVRVWGERRKE
ncbi:MAG: hypothetical protein HY232_11250, partial [Acidobacteria bacterium]|nr:hypothetical protein [Acidobacteriota bacterium]